MKYFKKNFKDKYERNTETTKMTSDMSQTRSLSQHKN